jgi:hypothetical protein
MLIKEADDKTNDLATLKLLLNHPAANAETKKRIEQEIRNISSGVKGEADAAYEFNFHYGPSKNWAVIHDLRLEHKGRVAQVDHLLVNRFLDVWVCESKRFAEGIAINEQGECAMFWNGKPTGIGSPHEQNAKHIAVVKAACDDGAVELPKRLGFSIKPAFSTLVVVSKNARVSRPKAKGWWDDGLVKADQVKAKIDKAVDGDNNILLATKIVGSDTLEAFARGLAALHVPASFDWHAKFGLPRETVTPVTPKTIQADEVAVPAELKKAGRSCHSCGVPVEDKVVTFCIRFNKARFGGNVYCQDCQKNFAKPA